MRWLLVCVFLAIIQLSSFQQLGGIIPVAYSPLLGVESSDFHSEYLKGVQINPEQFKWPFDSTGLYRTAVGEFNDYFGLNTTGEGVAYFITGVLPPRHTVAPNWLRITPYLPDLGPVVSRISTRNADVTEHVFISDPTLECRQLRELVSSNFKWSVLALNDSLSLQSELSKLKEYVDGAKIHYAICDGNSGDDFGVQALRMLLQTGIYFGSEIFVYTNKNMTDNEVKDKFKEFADAGAHLTVVAPVLCGSNSTPVDVALKALESLSIKYVGDSYIQLDGKTVPFTSPNFLSLIQTTKIEVPISNRNNYTICFTSEGYMCIIDFDIFEIQLDDTNSISSGFYDQLTGELTILSDIYSRPVVQLLAFQDTTFLPSLVNYQFSMAIQMINAIFSPEFPFDYEIVQEPFNENRTMQEVVEEKLSQPNATYMMSAFPLPLEGGMTVRHTEGVLFDGIVMIKSKTASELALFRIFDSLSGYIWLCVFASLIFVAIIFFIIKVVNDHQIQDMGFVPDDQNTSLFKRFLNVIFQNFSAVLLAKMLVKPKQTSLRVLYQSYWMASILFVATYAASLAEQRFVAHETQVPFNSLRGLLENDQGYRWIFLRNSSVIWKMQNSQDNVLTSLLLKAEIEWPQKMYAESVSDAAARMEDNDHLILISSQLEAKQILSEECRLSKAASSGGKSGSVENLYALGYILSGDDSFAKVMTDQIEAIASSQSFNVIELRAIGVGDCPLSSEEINMQKKSFSLKELGGLFIILLVGLVIAFIIAGIEFIIDKYPMYSQRKKDGGIRFGETYTSEVLNIQEDGIWIRLLESEATAFVDSSRIKSHKGADGRPRIELGSYVKATYMGNDPQTAVPVFTVTEEKVHKPERNDVVPPNNLSTEE